MLIMLSGGLDSQVLLAHMLEPPLRPVEALFIAYNQVNAVKEHKAAIKQTIDANVKLHTIEVSNLFEGSLSKLLRNFHYEEKHEDSIVIPFRNQVLISIAATQARIHGHKQLACALHKTTEEFIDSGESFILCMKGLCELQDIEFLTPFKNLTKKQVVEKGRKLNVAFKDSYSCYEGQEEPCGKCHACISREEALLI